MTEKKTKSAFSKWYEQHREGLNSARRLRYQNDPEYRGEVLRTQRERRQASPVPSRAGASRYKEVGGSTVYTYRISEVAEMVGKTVQTIRLWEAQGYIPKPTIPSEKRFYTKHQASLIVELSAVLDIKRRVPMSDRGDPLRQVLTKITSQWSLI